MTTPTDVDKRKAEAEPTDADIRLSHALVEKFRANYEDEQFTMPPISWPVLSARIATALAEEREAAFRQAIQIIADTQVVIDRTVVKRASDANGWYCAAKSFTKRLKAAIRTP